MYELIIQTQFNTIRMTIDDYNSPEVKEILDQPYIVSVEWHQIKGKTKVRKREKNV